MDRQRFKWMVSMAGMRFYLLRMALFKLARVTALRTVQVAFSVAMGFAGVWLLEGFQIIKYDDGPKLRPDRELAWRAKPLEGGPSHRWKAADSTGYAYEEGGEEEAPADRPSALQVRRETLPSDPKPLNSVRYVRSRAARWDSGRVPRRFVRAANFVDMGTTYAGSGPGGFDPKASKGILRRFDGIPMGRENASREDPPSQEEVEWAYGVLGEAERRGDAPPGAARRPDGEEARPSVAGLDPRLAVRARGGSASGPGLASSAALEEEARAIVSRHEAERAARLRYWRAMFRRLGWGLIISLGVFLAAALLSGLLKALIRLTGVQEVSEEEDLERRTRKLRLLFMLGLLGLASPASAAVRGKPLQPDGCWTLGIEECSRRPACKQETWMCDYVPEGKTFEEVCPNGGKGSCSPKSPWELCCPLDKAACSGYPGACRPKAWTCLPGKGEDCVYGTTGACLPRRAPYMVSDPVCDLRKPKEAPQADPAPAPPVEPAYRKLGFKTEREHELYILELRRENKLISPKDYEAELKRLKGSPPAP